MTINLFEHRHFSGGVFYMTAKSRQITSEPRQKTGVNPTLKWWYKYWYA